MISFLFLSSGLLRTIGQGPCEDVDEDFAEQTGFLGCRHNDTDGTVSTMIHKGNLSECALTFILDS